MIATSYHDERTPGVKLTIHVYCYPKARTLMWTEQRQSSPARPPRSTAGSAKFATPAETLAAFEARCAELEASGWSGGTRRGDDPGAKRPAPAAKVEAALDSLTDELVKALVAARRDVVRDRAALARALDRYRAARRMAGEPPDESAIHFFAVDGVGLEKARTPGLQRLSADAATVARWTATLEELVRGAPAAARPKTKTKPKPKPKPTTRPKRGR